ncbi:hypothetical protein DAPPUDRAFT_321968 [Daphnia pulex]|uniref:Kinesin motor domain-containing protein n=1 Tax=Daphnia pulex TaxID=6669 RepID=E9GUR0_DAPPU|nr:hypothetical protein DAPPUDRAFT_321968 [Daphnia pulex]|eukprot:EFX76777.1 hypothetical protein DAPPUDRAFT_321968 [Daphnia pulex]
MTGYMQLYLKLMTGYMQLNPKPEAHDWLHAALPEAHDWLHAALPEAHDWLHAAIVVVHEWLHATELIFRMSGYIGLRAAVPAAHSGNLELQKSALCLEKDVELQQDKANCSELELQIRTLRHKEMDRTEKLRAFVRVRSHQNENVQIEKMSLLKDLSDNSLEVPKTTHSSNNHRNNLGAPDKGSFFTTPLTSRRKSSIPSVEFNFDRSTVSGFISAIFSYGHSGSGKTQTYTIEGGPAGSESAGLIPSSGQRQGGGATFS